MSTVALDVEAVRARFSALRQPLAFFDGPGGTQVPDEVIDAVSRYYRESNANVSGPYATSRRTEALVTQARLTAADFLRCEPEETIFGAHLGVAFGRAELLESWRPYKVRPAADEPLGHRFETGTLAHELLAGFVAAVEYIESIGWEAIQAHERALGERFLAGLPDNATLYGLPIMDGRVATFAFNVAGVPTADAAGRLGDARHAVRHRHYSPVQAI